MLRRTIYSFHRILGTILSILFLMWFLSAFVMMYRTFPKLTDKQRFRQEQPLSRADCQEADSAIAASVGKPGLTSLKLNLYFGQTRLIRSCSETNEQMLIHHGQCDSIRKPSFEEIRRYAQSWSQAPIFRTDSLHDLEQWIPFGKLRPDLPIYKFYFADKLKHQLYISSRTGEALQFTDKDNRFWAWLGPIPHWVYFTKLRQDVALWKNVVITISGIGCIMCLAGIIIGIRTFLLIRRRKGTWTTPYRRFAYKWHHVTGFFFGFFVFSFIFSGMMSLADVPTSLVNIHKPNIQERAESAGSISGLNFRADYKQLLTDYPGQVKQIKWLSVVKTPAYEVVIGDSLCLFNASSERIKPLQVTRRMMEQMIEPGARSYRIDTLNEYDNYYGSPGKQLPLPVYKISVDDADGSTYYVQPHTGKLLYYNTNGKVGRWSYDILHRFALGVLVQHNTLRLCLLWLALIGGTLVSLTGLWISVAYVKKTLRRAKDINKNYEDF